MPRRLGYSEEVSDESALRIGELAAAVRLNPKTIRYYEAIGLLPTPQRTEAGYRLYGEYDRERLQFIRKAAAVGLSLQEIGELLGLRESGEQPCRHLGELVERKLVAVDDQIAALQAFREELIEVRNAATSERCEDGELCGVIEHHRPLREDFAFPPKSMRVRGRQ